MAMIVLKLDFSVRMYFLPVMSVEAFRSLKKKEKG
jgi:hypothetical protein